MDRIQKILSSRGLCSRRQAEKLILEGKVTCNGNVCTLGDVADPDIDQIVVDGKTLPSAGENVYIMLHKPKGYVTTLSDEKGRKHVGELVSDAPARVFPVGRLDMDSEGLLLMTNDGALANQLMHPSHNVDKIYRVTVKGYSSRGLELVKKPIVLDGYRIKEPEVKLLEANDDGRAVLEIVIHEGRNRQVRRMCAKAGMSVIRLVRVREGDVQLGALPRGKWRYLTEEEIASLR